MAGQAQINGLRRTSACVLAAGLALQSAEAGEWTLSGSVSAELRAFPQSPEFLDQDAGTFTGSFAFEPKATYEWNDGADRFVFAPFLRLDSADSNRSHADIREAKWLHIGDGWELVVGVDKVFWGVAESRHLVDIVNQDDAVEDVDGEEKLGQPMVNLNLLGDWGKFGVFLLPGFRERPFPADDARLRGPLLVAARHATFDSGAGNDGLDFALRYAKVLGNWDLGLSYFHGTSREPRLIPILGPGGRAELAPHYDLIDQAGLDLQYTSGAWLWKLESMARSGHGDPFFASVAGFEYTRFGALGTEADVGLLLEYSYDGRDTAESPPTIYNDDVFIGARLALNDIDGTSVLAGGLVDVENGATALLLEAERRIGDDWKVEVEGRFFVNAPDADPLAAFKRDGYLALRVSRYF